MDTANAAHPLPPETWLDIIRFVRMDSQAAGRIDVDTKTLRTITLLCSFLRDLAQPELYRSIAFKTGKKAATSTTTRLKGFDELLKNRPESADWIKSFTCYGEGSDIGAQFPLISSLFVRLSSLIFFAFYYMPITPQMIAHVNSLQYLQSAVMDGQITPPQNQSPQDQVGSNLPPIVSLSIQIEEQIHPSVARLASATTLRSLALMGPESVQVLHDISKDYPTHNLAGLTSLYLSSTDLGSQDLEPQSVLEFASLFPNLNLLRLHTSRAMPHRNLEELDMQQLKSFDGSLPYALLLVPGRPVEELTLRCWSTDEVFSHRNLDKLASGSSSLRKLVLDGGTWLDGCLEDIARVFPNLTLLEMHDHEGNCVAWLEQHFAEVMKQLPYLETFRITTGGTQSDVPKMEEVPMEEQEHMVGALGPSPSPLCEVQFADTLWQWNQGRWTHTEAPSFVYRWGDRHTSTRALVEHLFHADGFYPTV